MYRLGQVKQAALTAVRVVRQETLWNNTEGHVHTRHMTVPLAREQNGSADIQLYHWLTVSKKSQILSSLIQSSS